MSKFRAPAVPLITVDPFFSIWSMGDTLYGDVTRHWTETRNNMLGVLTVDGLAYRFMGQVFSDNLVREKTFVIPQKDAEIRPMQTIYTFQNEKVRLTVTFMTPLLLDDLKLMTRPVSYISYKVESVDGKEHACEIYFGMNCEIAVNAPEQTLTAELYENGARCGRGDKGVLAVSGDHRRIEWGWMHLYGDSEYTSSLEDAFTLNKRYEPERNRIFEGITQWDKEKEFPASAGYYIGLERAFTLKNTETGFVCAAYDDIHSIMYFGKTVDAYYKKDGETFEDVRKKALVEYDDICGRVAAAEEEILTRARKVSDKYADLIALVYRQVIAAHKLTWDGEEIQFLSKECFSNGCIGTLDVTYPSIPMFLLYRPELVEGMMNPLFKYAASDAWEYDFAPHDVGQYPLANGQVYGLDEETGEMKYDMQMPVEECGNAILSVYALCHYKKDFAYAQKHMDILKQWAEYLITYGVDPENQLCTDDFAGHLAHNVNLSAKAAMGIAAFGKLCEELGDAKTAKRYLDNAKEHAAKWKEMALEGDHYRLAFDQKDTWSIKYNLVWDKIFGWNIFDADVYETEIAYYKTKFNRYGLPLDSRSDYTKSDWEMWATRLSDDKEFEEMIINSLWDMCNESHSRVPFTDWYYTSTAVERTFQNRTVMGGLFINMI